MRELINLKEKRKKEKKKETINSDIVCFIFLMDSEKKKE